MTNGKAINILLAIKKGTALSFLSDETIARAVDIAISVLEKQEVDKCCETCKYKHLDVDACPCCDCIRAKDHYVPYTEEES